MGERNAGSDAPTPRRFPGLWDALYDLQAAVTEAPRSSCENLRCKHGGRSAAECLPAEMWISFDNDTGWEIEVTVHDPERNYACKGPYLGPMIQSAWERVVGTQSTRSGSDG